MYIVLAQERLLFLSATCFQGSAMAATGEWRDAQNSHAHRSIVPYINSTHISISMEGAQSLLA